MAFCNNYPQVNGKNSKLFDEVLTASNGNREVAKHIWGLTQVPSYMQRLNNIEKNAMGEPTLQSFLAASGLTNGINMDKVQNYHQLKQFGAIDSNDQPVIWKYVEDIADKVQQFNDNNPQFAATIVEANGGFTVDILNRLGHERIVEQFKFNNTLHHRLEGILNSIGFAVKRDDKLSQDGIFDPRNAETTANNLLTVIRIANNQAGRNAFPEEFSHLAIAGLKYTNLVQRILSALHNEALLQAIYGEQYQAYFDRYNGNIDKLVEEAAGKILSQYIINNESQGNIDLLLERLYKQILSRTSQLSTEQISDMINKLSNDLKQLSTEILYGEIMKHVSIDDILKSESFDKLASSADEQKQLLDQMQQSIAEQINVYTSKKQPVPAQLLQSFSHLRDNMQPVLYISGFKAYLTDLEKTVKYFRDTYNQLSKNNLTDDFRLINKGDVSTMLNQMKNFYVGAKNILDQLQTLKVEDGIQMFGDKASMKVIQEQVYRYVKMIDEFGNDIDIERKKFEYADMLDHWGPSDERQITIGPHKGETESLAAILDMAPKDSTFLNSNLLSLGESTDAISQAIYTLTRRQQHKRDQILNIMASRLRALHRMLIDSGSGTDFIYETLTYKDKKGNERESVYILNDINWDAFFKAKQAFYDSVKHLSWVERQKRYLAWLKANCYYRYINDPQGKSDIDSAAIHVEHEASPDDMSITTLSNVEWIPKHKPGDLYHRENAKLNSLTKAQRDYYDAMIRMKRIAEASLPTSKVNTYRPIYISNDTLEIVEQNISDPEKLVRTLADRASDIWKKRVDNDEYGGDINLHDIESGVELTDPSEDQESSEQTETGQANDKSQRKPKIRYVRTNAMGMEDADMPIYYIHKLHDNNRMSKDFTSSMMAYMASCINYGQMQSVYEEVKLLLNAIYERPVKKTAGSMQYMSKVKSFGGVKFEAKPVTIPGGESNIYKAAEQFVRSEYLGQRKQEELIEMHAGNKEVNVDIGWIGDKLMNFTTMCFMSLNEFAGINNDLIGRFQMFLESRGKGFYNTKNLMRAEKRYFTDLWAYLGNLNETNYNDLMHLLIDKFNVLDDFYDDLKRRGYYQGTLAKVLGNSSLLVFNNMGEHHMHVTSFYALLDNIKVKHKVGSTYEEISLLDAFEVVPHDVFDLQGKKIATNYTAELKSGLTDLNGNIINQSGLIELIEGQQFSDERVSKSIYNDNLVNWVRAATRRVNQRLFGAYAMIDRGAGSKSVWFRAVLQFRQWMPQHFERRWGVAKHDTELGMDYEGFYRCAGRFLYGLMQDLRKGELHIAASWDSLSDQEKGYIRQALDEMMALIFCLSSVYFIKQQVKKHKDDDEETFLRPYGDLDVEDMTLFQREYTRFRRQVYLQLLRMKSDIGLAAPWISMPESFLEFFKNPAGVLSNMEKALDVVNITFLFDEVGSGSHKGENKWWYNAQQILPPIRNIQKTWDFIDDDTQFNRYAS